MLYCPADTCIGRLIEIIFNQSGIVGDCKIHIAQTNSGLGTRTTGRYSDAVFTDCVDRTESATIFSCACTGDVINVTAFLIIIADDPDGCFVAQRKVHHTFNFSAWVAFGHISPLSGNFSGVTVKIWLVGNHTNHARL